MCRRCGLGVSLVKNCVGLGLAPNASRSGSDFEYFSSDADLLLRIFENETTKSRNLLQVTNPKGRVENVLYRSKIPFDWKFTKDKSGVPSGDKWLIWVTWFFTNYLVHNLDFTQFTNSWLINGSTSPILTGQINVNNWISILAGKCTNVNIRNHQSQMRTMPPSNLHCKTSIYLITNSKLAIHKQRACEFWDVCHFMELFCPSFYFQSNFVCLICIWLYLHLYGHYNYYSQWIKGWLEYKKQKPWYSGEMNEHKTQTSRETVRYHAGRVSSFNHSCLSPMNNFEIR